MSEAVEKYAVEYAEQAMNLLGVNDSDRGILQKGL